MSVCQSALPWLGCPIIHRRLLLIELLSSITTKLCGWAKNRASGAPRLVVFCLVAPEENQCWSLNDECNECVHVRNSGRSHYSSIDIAF
eukprot:scaffold95106_cov17-Prasinocladus_malaysianus.AAC.1